MAYALEATGTDVGGILVNVEPLQAAFFAGESFSARITFTNSHPPVVPAANAPKTATLVPERPATSTGVAFKHKRAAHSITYGSAPLANPPTSPGTPNYSSQFAMSTPTLSSSGIVTSRTTVPVTAGAPPPRKGLIGPKVKDANSGSIYDRTRGVHARRALSVDVTSPPSKGLGPSTGPRVHPPSPLARPRVASTALEASTVAAGMSRSTSMPIPKSHPHARKQSVVDGHDPSPISSSISSSQSAPYPSPLSATPSSGPPSPSTGVSTSSSFPGPLDPITETPPKTPHAVPLPAQRDRSSSVPGPISSAGAILHSPKPSKPDSASQMVLNNARIRAASLTHGSIGLGQPPALQANSMLHPPTTMNRSATEQGTAATLAPKTAAPGRSTFSSSFTPPGTEVVLWSYAQLLGTIEVDETSGLIDPDACTALRSKLNTLRSDGVIGGGRMDIGAPVTPNLTGSHGRARRGFISSFLGGSAAPSPTTPGSTTFGAGLSSALGSLWNSPNPSPMSPSFGASASASPMVGMTGGLPLTALPSFETQPSMLAIDLSLAPGESRTFTYEVPLPNLLPPTFRGKSMRFSYHLVVGSAKPGGGGGMSKIMRVPIRIYNNVSVEHPPIPYDLLWPVARRKAGPVKTAVFEDIPDPNAAPFGKGPVKRIRRRGAPESFEQYAARLLSTSNDQGVNGGNLSTKSPNGIPGVLSPSATLASVDDEVASGHISCRESVEMLTRVSRKMSYDISKDGVKIATVTFVKTAFRLGESVMGVVEMNSQSSRARVLKFSAMLESHEIIPSPLADTSIPMMRSRGLRRVHAEHHGSMVMDSVRSPFTLDIPSDAAPGFRVMMEDETPIGGLEWKVRICFLASVPPESPGGTQTRHLVRDGVGGDWGTSWKASSSLVPLSQGVPTGGGYKSGRPASSSAWSFFSSSRTLNEEPEGWGECSAEVVECEVGITVWPGNTLYRPAQLDFEI